jgi:hypothetical protein
VRDFLQLEALRNQPGLRVLDQFNPDRPTASPARSRHSIRQILAGKYSVVIFDSLANPVYRKDNLHLHALPVIPETVRVADSTASAPATRALRNDATASSPDVSPNFKNEITGGAKKDTLRVQQ